MKKALAGLLCLAFVLSMRVPTVSAFDKDKAIGYLGNKQQNPWTVMAFAAAGNSPDASVLPPGVSVSDYSALILAVTAAGNDPRDFKGVDYVEKLKSSRSNGQIGDPELINDDIFGLLALAAAGSENQLIVSEKEYLLSKQSSNGGWGFAASGSPDSNMTAAAILALLSADVEVSDPAISSAIGFLREAQNGDGGFAYQPDSPWGRLSDASSTAWAIWAMNALGLSQDSFRKQATPKEYLVSLQADDGYFRYQSDAGEDSFSPTTTAYALIALSGKTLPLSRIQDANRHEYRIEGSASTVCSGSTGAVTAMDIVVAASDSCGFSYQIAESGFGKYLQALGTDQAAGMRGWMYLVNYQSPSVGASDYVLKTGDGVVWFFGDYDLLPMRLSLEKAKADVSAPVGVKVEEFISGNWEPAEDAAIKGVPAPIVQTDINGAATLSLSAGSYSVWAEKIGGIRSNKASLTVGDNAAAASSVVDLTGYYDTGIVEGASIGIAVTPSKLDFGPMRRSETKKKQVIIENSGDVTATVSAEVTGEGLYTENLMVNGAKWTDFSLALAPTERTEKEVALLIPLSYSSDSGNKTGKLIFWARIAR